LIYGRSRTTAPLLDKVEFRLNDPSENVNCTPHDTVFQIKMIAGRTLQLGIEIGPPKLFLDLGSIDEALPES
jgi:hypothetical protein